MILFRAQYTPVPDTDREHAQGAIERCDVAHREIAKNVWLIRVDDGDAAQWEARLNENAGAKNGTFHVTPASEDERKKVESGEIVLQK